MSFFVKSNPIIIDAFFQLDEEIKAVNELTPFHPLNGSVESILHISENESGHDIAEPKGMRDH